jgi:hypothetical protein
LQRWGGGVWAIDSDLMANVAGMAVKGLLKIRGSRPYNNS